MNTTSVQKDTITALKKAITAIQDGDYLEAEMSVHNALDKVWWLQESVAPQHT
jgi:hypothetical protein